MKHREIPFLHFIGHEEGPLLFTDASSNELLGFSCVWPSCDEWTTACWPVGFFQEQKPDITLLELYAIIITVDVWAPELAWRQVQLHSDNKATVYLINAKSSKKPYHMNLLWHLTLTCMYFQIHVIICHECSCSNKQADSLSRGDLRTFFKVAPPHMSSTPKHLPSPLWPLS